MKRTLIAAVIIHLLMNAAAMAATSANVIDRSKALIDDGRIDEAIVLLETSRANVGATYETDFLLIRATAWAGRHARAIERMDALEREYGANSDTMIFRAHILRYRGELPEARAQLQATLAAYPESDEARKALDGLERHRAPETDRGRWRLHSGAEFSHFRRQSRASWRQQYLNLGYVFPGGRKGAYGEIRRYEQFSEIDLEFEGGANLRPSVDSNLYFALTAVPDAAFRPNWRISAGGDIRLLEAFPAPPAGVWATADLRQDFYDGVAITTFNPGVRVAIGDAWRLGARIISVTASDERTAFGWDARVDGRLADGWRFFVGAANAPETIAAETVRTSSVFGGLSIDITERVALRVSAARDDRENSFIREIFHVGVAANF